MPLTFSQRLSRPSRHALQVQQVSAFYASPDGRIFAQLLAAGVDDPNGARYFRDFFLAGRRDTTRQLWQRAIDTGINQQEAGAYSLEIEGDLGFATLTSATSYSQTQSHSVTDASLTYGVIWGGLAPFTEDFDLDKVTQEFRLASELKGPVNFMAGAYYQNASQETDVLLKGNTVLHLPAISQWNQHNIDIRSLSLLAGQHGVETLVL